MSEDIYSFKPVAHIRTGFPEKFGIPRQASLVPDAKGRIVFENEFRHPDIIKGIEEFERLWLLFVFSENVRGKWNATVTPPRLGGKEHKGVFATRAPFRPNPIGLSCVKLEEVIHDEKDGDILIVSGVDMLDGTPILDIKPYITYADAWPGAASGFADREDQMILDLEIPEEFLDDIGPDIRGAVRDIIRQDPRPAFIHDEDRIWGVSYAGLNIRFRVKDGTAVVCEVGKTLV